MSSTTFQRPYELLTQIADRYNEADSELPVVETEQNEWRGIGFQLGGQRFVAPLTEVDEILYIPDCTKVPGVKNWVNGVANVRGRLLSVIDLGLFFSAEHSIASRNSRVLTVNTGDLYSGVIVDHVLGLQTFSQSAYSEKGPISEKFVPYVAGCFERDDQCWSIFRLFELVRSPSFLQVAV